MGKADKDSSGHGDKSSGRKNKSRMNYLKQVKRGGGGGGGGWRGGRGGGRGGQQRTTDADGYLQGDYVRSYDNRGQKFQKQRRPREQLGFGMKGFLLTTNFRERECTQEAYNLLNEYLRPEDEDKVDEAVEIQSDQLDKQDATTENNKSSPMESEGSTNVTEEQASGPSKDAKEEKDEGDDEEDEDIEQELEKELKELKNSYQQRKFNAVDTGIKNVIFIKTSVTRPSNIVYRIFSDVFEKKESKSRNILRFIPIEGTCITNDESIRKMAKEIFTPYFKDGYKTFKVIINVRYSQAAKDQIITTLAAVVSEINPLCVVNLVDPEYIIVAEIIKNVLMLSVVKDFTKFKKFNIAEIVTPTPASKSNKPETKAVSDVPISETTSKPDEEAKVEEKMNVVASQSEVEQKIDDNKPAE